jgi:hypothetical protein
VDDGGLVEIESESEFDARSFIRRYPVRNRAHPLIRKTSGLRKEVGVVYLDHKRGSDDDVASMSVNSKRIANPVLFICDVQEKFRGAIWEFDKVYVVPPFVESNIFCCIRTEYFHESQVTDTLHLPQDQNESEDGQSR